MQTLLEITSDLTALLVVGISPLESLLMVVEEPALSVRFLAGPKVVAQEPTSTANTALVSLVAEGAVLSHLLGTTSCPPVVWRSHQSISC